MTEAAATSRPDVSTLTFEAALDEMEQIVKALESGQAPLEQSISAYERGVALKKHCEDKLRSAQSKIDQIAENPDGSLSAQPFTTTE